MIRSLSLGVALAAVVMAVAPASGDTTFYVSPDGSDSAAGDREHPFASVARAREAVRALKKGGPLAAPVTVYLRSGVHRIGEPLVLTSEDSGTAEAAITYAAAPGESATISGGRRITGWRAGDKGLWVADVPALANGEPWVFRHLYADSHYRRRARSPNDGYFRVAGTPDGGKGVSYNTRSQRFQFARGDLDPNWKNLTGVEVVVYHFWTDTHLRVQSIDPATRIVTFQHPSRKIFTDDHRAEGARYHVENVFEALDQPGEWYLDRSAARLFYMPMPGEDPATAEIVAPVAPALLLVQGEPVQGQYVEHVSFRDLTFEHTRFELPVNDPNDLKQGSGNVPAGLRLTGARNVTIERCAFRNLGTFGVQLNGGCSDVRIVSNEFSELAAGAIRIDGGTQKNHPLDRTAHNTVSDNHIHNYGVTYPSAVAVLLMHTEGNTVSHNHIHDGYYTAISVGWIWGYDRSVSRDNVIEYNHIHDVGKRVMSDMGGIYTLGVSPGTRIRHNHVHHVEANTYGGWGIYLDEGSTAILVENNIVHDTMFSPFMIHFSKECTVRNNIWAFGKLDQISRGQAEPHKSVFFETNIVYWTEGKLFKGRWSDRPYTFHFHSKDKSGTREVTSTADFDYNIYFNPNRKLEDVSFSDMTFEEWRKKGRDVHSVYADPQFENAEKRDFRLKPTSPALKLGFKAFDADGLGPRTPVGPATRLAGSPAKPQATTKG